MRALAIAGLALALLAPTLAAGGGAPPCASSVGDLVVGSAHGRIATPCGAPRGLVVILHGYGHQAADHDAHLARLAELGFVAFAMDYSGPVDGFPLRAGALDTEAALAQVRGEWGFSHGVLFSVSMGTAVASMVLADEHGFFTAWVDSEGLSQLAETWAEATALAPANGFAKLAAQRIQEECGGSPAVAPGCYHERSAALRAYAFEGLQEAILLHDVNDGLVPYNQGREMEAALAARGVPTEFYTVLRGEAGHEGTTLTSYGGENVDGLAGHGDEGDD